MRRIISALAAAVILISSVFSVTAAGGDGLEAKQITVYLYSLEETDTFDCLFKDGVDLPYIAPEDFLNVAYVSDFSTVKNSDGTFTVTSPDNGDMVIDPEDDVIHFDSFEEFAFFNANSIYEREDDFVDYVTDIEGYIYTKDSDDPNSLDIDIGKYGIDAVTDGENVYLPISVVSNMFACSYQSALYLDGVIYFNRVMDFETYFDSSSLYETLDRDPALIDETYNEMCFVVDNFYGFPVKCKASDSVREKGFDRTLDEYSSVSAEAKRLLHSTNKIDFLKGLIYLDTIFDDGGHTSFSLGYLTATDYYPSSPYATQAISLLTQAASSGRGPVFEYLMSMMETYEPDTKLESAKNAAFAADYEEVNSWDGIVLYRNGDTVIFSFDEFLDEVVEPFKWSLDYAAENGVENFVIDLSTNGGGSTEPMTYMLDMMIGECSTFTLNETTGNILEDVYLADRNLDEVFDDNDLEVSYDLNFAILTSSASFSAANLMPCIAKEYGIRIIGERSGGGTCALSILTLPDSAIYSISSSIKLTYKDGRDVDGGVDPDVELTNGYDYSDLFDIDNIRSAMKDGKPADKTKDKADTAKPEKHGKQISVVKKENVEGMISTDTAFIISAAIVALCAGAATAVIIMSKKKNR